MSKAPKTGLFCRILVVISLLFSASCALSPQTRADLNGGMTNGSGTYDPTIKSYCKVGPGDLLDSTTVQLMSIVPDTYCLYDNFGVDRSVVLAVLKKYQNATSVSVDDAKYINETLNVSKLVAKIAELQKQEGNIGASTIGYPVEVASQDATSLLNQKEQFAFLPAVVPAIAEAVPEIVVLETTLGDLFLEIPGFARFMIDNPAFFDTDEISAEAAKNTQKIADILKDIEQVIDDDLCKNLSCKEVTTTDVSEGGFEDAPPKLQTCSDSVLQNLQNRKNNICNAARACYLTDTKEQIIEKISANSACIDARRTVTNTCYGGLSDAVHDQQIANRIKTIKYCQYLLSKKK
jgi:hypothetical protein